MFKKEILENERRSEIYRFIEENPGVHLRHIQRELDLPLSSLEYHVNYLVRKGVIFREKDRSYTRYYVRQLDSEDRKVLSSLRQRKLREIALKVLLYGKAKYHDLLTDLRLPSSTLSYYLKFLVKRNILEKHRIGRKSIYTVKDENRIIKALMAYRSSFTDKMVDKVLALWMETGFRQLGEDKPIKER
ncbi:hypothetical protein GTO27_01075 [Candidatus Bathyarchaeota archaeon]|nr:hypothetical protein [Candidatus Bathyarchaeota archaeon]